MRHRFAAFVVLTSASALFQLAACGDKTSEPNDFPTSPAPDGKAKPGPGPDPDRDADPGIDNALPEPSTEGRVYAHTTRKLFLYEPINNVLTEIGTFSCLDPTNSLDYIIDLAVDRTGTMYATTLDRFLKVDPITAKCDELGIADIDLDYPNALSFVPAGTVDPTKEALVGYASDFNAFNAVIYVQIDTTNGKMTRKGNMNATAAGPQYRASGDFVSIIADSNRTYATVKLKTDGGTGTDLLAQINPVSGQVIKIIGDTKQNDLWGVGYWAGKGYGFSSNGRIIQIDMATGLGVIVKEPKTDAGGILPWYGAGSTTQAPLN